MIHQGEPLRSVPCLSKYACVHSGMFVPQNRAASSANSIAHNQQWRLAQLRRWQGTGYAVMLRIRSLYTKKLIIHSQMLLRTLNSVIRYLVMASLSSSISPH